MKLSVFTIPCVLSLFIYAITIPIEQYFIFGEENCSISISERISLPYPISTTTTTAVQQTNIFYHVNYVKIKNYKKYGKTLSKLPLMKYSSDKN